MAIDRAALLKKIADSAKPQTIAERMAWEDVQLTRALKDGSLRLHDPAQKKIEILRAAEQRQFGATAKETKARRFVLNRSIDATGTSGTGIVAEGIQFSNGQVVIHWLSQLEAINVYANAVVLEQLHGHGGNTVVEWIDT